MKRWVVGLVIVFFCGSEVSASPLAKCLNVFSTFAQLMFGLSRREETAPPVEAAEVQYKSSRKVTTFQLNGEIIFDNENDVWTLLDAHFLQYRVLRAEVIILDLTHLKFIDSSGVELLLRAQKRARQLGMGLVMLNAQAHVRNMLRIKNVDHLILETSQ